MPILFSPGAAVRLTAASLGGFVRLLSVDCAGSELPPLCVRYGGEAATLPQVRLVHVSGIRRDQHGNVVQAVALHRLLVPRCAPDTRLAFDFDEQHRAEASGRQGSPRGPPRRWRGLMALEFAESWGGPGSEVMPPSVQPFVLEQPARSSGGR